MFHAGSPAGLFDSDFDRSLRTQALGDNAVEAPFLSLQQDVLEAPVGYWLILQ